MSVKVQDQSIEFLNQECGTERKVALSVGIEFWFTHGAHTQKQTHTSAHKHKRTQTQVHTNTRTHM